MNAAPTAVVPSGHRDNKANYDVGRYVRTAHASSGNVPGGAALVSESWNGIGNYMVRGGGGAISRQGGAELSEDVHCREQEGPNSEEHLWQDGPRDIQVLSWLNTLCVYEMTAALSKGRSSST